MRAHTHARASLKTLTLSPSLSPSLHHPKHTHSHRHARTHSFSARPSDMTLTPCPPLSSPPSSPLLPRLSFVCQSIPMHSKSDQVFYYSVFHPLIFFPPPPLFPLSGGGLGVAGLYFPTGFARAGPVAGFQGDTLLLAFSDLRQVGLCLPRGPLSFIFSFCVFFFFIFFIYPTIFFFCPPPTSLSFSSFSHPPSHSPQPSSSPSSPFIWFSDFIPSSFSLLFFFLLSHIPVVLVFSTLLFTYCVYLEVSSI